MSVLVVNAGSSSIKCALFKNDSKEAIWKEHLDLKEGNLEDILKNAPKTSLAAIGHRIVHGGDKFFKATLLTPEAIKDLEEISFLAPLHNPANLKGVYLTQKLFPNVLQFAVFDTSFHHTLPDYAYTYPLPLKLKAAGVRKYGFHGISHSYTAQKASEFFKKKDLKLVSCHLGAGCSLCAIKEGKSVDTTMGMTPLEGLMMARRSGSVDPSILFFLQREEKWSIDSLEKLLNHESGLYGVSDLSDDIRDLMKMAEKNKKARLGLEMFIYRLQGYIGMMIASLKGIDALVFTGGIGENISWVREKACEAFSFLGLELDLEKNNSLSREEREISSKDSKIKALVIPAFEEGVIAKEIFHSLQENILQQSS